MIALIELVWQGVALGSIVVAMVFAAAYLSARAKRVCAECGKRIDGRIDTFVAVSSWDLRTWKARLRRMFWGPSVERNIKRYHSGCYHA